MAELLHNQVVIFWEAEAFCYYGMLILKKWAEVYIMIQLSVLSLNVVI